MIPVTGIVKASMINTELKKVSTTRFSINSPEARKLAGKNLGRIAFSDFRGKSNIQVGISIHESSINSSGSSGTFSDWTNWISLSSEWGFINGLKVENYSWITSGNYDEISCRIEVANRDDTNKKITKFGSWGDGSNWTSPQSFSYQLTEQELATLGGSGSKIIYRYQIMVNRGSSGCTHNSKVTITTT
ncbi:MAG: hypothetical protein ACRC5T_11280 [Cetobacterium sp.]